MKAILTALLFPVLFANAQSGFDKKIADAAKQLKCEVPGEQTPVTLNAQTIDAGDSLAIIVKVAIAPGWHIYSYVPDNMPYIPIDHILQLPDNVRAVGKWQATTEPSTTVNDPGVLIYETEAVFIQKAVKTAGAKTGKINAGLYYQTCNLRQCLQPVEKTFELGY
jgi:DsbC/DsbD-like thiol-disulfide interchange protein